MAMAEAVETRLAVSKGAAKGEWRHACWVKMSWRWRQMYWTSHMMQVMER
jgi:hypothetical protein